MEPNRRTDQPVADSASPVATGKVTPTTPAEADDAAGMMITLLASDHLDDDTKYGLRDLLLEIFKRSEAIDISTPDMLRAWLPAALAADDDPMTGLARKLLALAGRVISGGRKKHRRKLAKWLRKLLRQREWAAAPEAPAACDSISRHLPSRADQIARAVELFDAFKGEHGVFGPIQRILLAREEYGSSDALEFKRQMLANAIADVIGSGDISGEVYEAIANWVASLRRQTVGDDLYPDNLREVLPAYLAEIDARNEASAAGDQSRAQLERVGELLAELLENPMTPVGIHNEIADVTTQMALDMMARPGVGVRVTWPHVIESLLAKSEGEGGEPHDE